MTTFFENIQELWNTWSPVVISIGVSLSVAIGAILLVWSKVKPFLETLGELKDKLFNKTTETFTNVTNEMTLIDLDTKILDLKAKIESPAISDELKQLYITQLAKLEVLKEKIDAGLIAIEDINTSF